MKYSLNVYIYSLHEKHKIKNIKVNIKIKIELTHIDFKSRTNMGDKFEKSLKRKQDYR